ncbi:AraC family transcriptional regulator [Paenibacillus hodogayensis]|uniref:AraC family transcriptional regulator n=1 Tax=Paenibacillus hodogayensis TaxID=279208 RepID=A0ABV5VYI8_9BACL
MIRKVTQAQPQFDDDLYSLLYKQWEQKSPDELYHAHDGIEFLYVHEGRGRLILNDRLYMLQPRTLVYFKPYQVHLVWYETPRLRSLIQVNTSVHKPFLHVFPHLAAFVADLEGSEGEPQMVRLNARQDEDLTLLLGQLRQTLDHVADVERKEQFLLFWMQFLSYLKVHVFTEKKPGSSLPSRCRSPHVEAVIAWIDRHFREPFCLEALAAEVHLSATYLSGLFRSATGTTITGFLMNRRLEQARFLLTTTVLPIDRVGKQSGFPNSAHFSRCFKKRFSVTPQRYRAEAALLASSIDAHAPTKP